MHEGKISTVGMFDHHLPGYWGYCTGYISKFGFAFITCPNITSQIVPNDCGNNEAMGLVKVALTAPAEQQPILIWMNRVWNIKFP